MILLGVNVDHVATIRQARGVSYPDPVQAAEFAIKGGADQITIHLREDRRHIQDEDVFRMKAAISVPLNLEMAASDEIIKIAASVLPKTATLVPEKREELTTEGGLDVALDLKKFAKVVARLKDAGIEVSMFIDPEKKQIDASLEICADAVEFHTGKYCDAKNPAGAAAELEKLRDAVKYASGFGLKLCAGHGINYDNARICVETLSNVVEYNIGHAIVARACMTGMESAVREMKEILQGGQVLTRDRFENPGLGTRDPENRKIRDSEIRKSCRGVKS
jgi:pyridoxine 5-phosphate synthase